VGWIGGGGTWGVSGRKNGLMVNGTTTINAKRGSQWDRCQIGVFGRGHIHWKKKLMKNDRYDCNQGEERNPMG
jgi:hypothetical protein